MPFPREKSFGCLYNMPYSAKYEKSNFNMVYHVVDWYS